MKDEKLKKNLQIRRATALANALVAIQNWNKNPTGILVGNRKAGQCAPDFCENEHHSQNRHDENIYEAIHRARNTGSVLPGKKIGCRTY
jgi:hypothetical protein